MTPPHAPHIRPAADAAERAALGEVLSFCFAFPPEDTAPWFERAGAGEVRVAALGDEIAGGWINVPMGQHWGGRSVPLLGVAGVGIAPQHRGKGLATAMMRAAVVEARSRGLPLLGLFASTQDLYRRAGFEQAGVLGNVRLDPAHLPRRAGAVPLCALGPDDEPAVELAYAEIAQHRPGWLDRGPYIWARVRQPRGTGATKAWGVRGEDGALLGMVRMAQERQPGELHTTVHVTDLWAQTPDAGVALLACIGAQATIAHDARWRTGPDDPLLALLPNAAFELRHGEHYMLCVADVARALECRGWPAGVAGEWAFELVGAAVPDDDGPWTLHVREGEARCSRGGRPAVQVTGRALASLYAGFRSPWALAQTGGLTGDAAVFPQLAALFTGGAPIIPDMF